MNKAVESMESEEQKAIRLEQLKASERARAKQKLELYRHRAEDELARIIQAADFLERAKFETSDSGKIFALFPTEFSSDASVEAAELANWTNCECVFAFGREKNGSRPFSIHAQDSNREILRKLHEAEGNQRCWGVSFGSSIIFGRSVLSVEKVLEVLKKTY